MADIVERLRAHGLVNYGTATAAICDMAADEIERLRAALRDIGSQSVMRRRGQIAAIKSIVLEARPWPTPPAGDEESEGR
jgi:hypothetical protein